MAHGPSCSAACGIFPDQGSNPCPLHWQADSQPLRHQGSPKKWHILKNHRERKTSKVLQACDPSTLPSTQVKSKRDSEVRQTDFNVKAATFKPGDFGQFTQSFWTFISSYTKQRLETSAYRVVKIIHDHCVSIWMCSQHIHNTGSHKQGIRNHEGQERTRVLPPLNQTLHREAPTHLLSNFLLPIF